MCEHVSLVNSTRYLRVTVMYKCHHTILSYLLLATFVSQLCTSVTTQFSAITARYLRVTVMYKCHHTILSHLLLATFVSQLCTSVTTQFSAIYCSLPWCHSYVQVSPHNSQPSTARYLGVTVMYKCHHTILSHLLLATFESQLCTSVTTQFSAIYCSLPSCHSYVQVSPHNSQPSTAGYLRVTVMYKCHHTILSHLLLATFVSQLCTSVTTQFSAIYCSLPSCHSYVQGSPHNSEPSTARYLRVTVMYKCHHTILSHLLLATFVSQLCTSVTTQFSAIYCWLPSCHSYVQVSPHNSQPSTARYLRVTVMYKCHHTILSYLLLATFVSQLCTSVTTQFSAIYCSLPSCHSYVQGSPHNSEPSTARYLHVTVMYKCHHTILSHLLLATFVSQLCTRVTTQFGAIYCSLPSCHSYVQVSPHNSQPSTARYLRVTVMYKCHHTILSHLLLATFVSQLCTRVTTQFGAIYCSLPSCHNYVQVSPHNSQPSTARYLRVTVMYKCHHTILSHLLLATFESQLCTSVTTQFSAIYCSLPWCHSYVQVSPHNSEPSPARYLCVTVMYKCHHTILSHLLLATFVSQLCTSVTTQF